MKKYCCLLFWILPFQLWAQLSLNEAYQEIGNAQVSLASKGLEAMKSRKAVAEARQRQLEEQLSALEEFGLPDQGQYAASLTSELQEISERIEEVSGDIEVKKRAIDEMKAGFDDLHRSIPESMVPEGSQALLNADIEKLSLLREKLDELKAVPKSDEENVAQLQQQLEEQVKEMLGDLKMIDPHRVFPELAQGSEISKVKEFKPLLSTVQEEAKVKVRKKVSDHITEYNLSDIPRFQDLLFFETNMAVLKSDLRLFQLSPSLNYQWSKRFSLGVGSVFTDEQQLPEQFRRGERWKGQLRTHIDLYKDVLSFKGEAQMGRLKQVETFLGGGFALPSTANLPLSMSLLRNVSNRQVLGSGNFISPWRMRLSLDF